MTGSMHFALLTSALFLGCGSDKSPQGDADADSDPDTDTGPEGCGNVGDTRADECGCQEICAKDFTWQPDGACGAECSPDEREQEPCGTCGATERTCRKDCTWGLWSECAESPFDECERGDARNITTEGCSSGEVRAEVCSIECLWEERDCSTECAGSPRGVGTDAEEVCVPGGPFIMGGLDEADPADDPEHEVVLSPFFIGRYEVTQERFAACGEAGTCDPTTPDPDFLRRFQPLNWYSASDFCAWIGARLATEAEWEKAARGPSPDRRRYPWGDAEPTCKQASSAACPAEAVDSTPDGASPYGVERLCDEPDEWVHDAYDADYYATSPGVDPPGPAEASDIRVVRGPNANPGAENLPLTTREHLDADVAASAIPSFTVGARCVRGAEVYE